MALNEQTRFHNLAATLLEWYAAEARDLPWRIGPEARAAGQVADPYRIWLAEIMLQQTTVAHATRYYLDFTARWPKVEDLAAADDADIMAAWAGLGYYARARNLLKCAREVTALGKWPDTADELRRLPGIGPYTAGAVAALAFGRREAAVDGNVERVFARLLAATGDWSSEKTRIRERVAALVPADRPAEFAEALMDLGATICTPRSPNCLLCPLREACIGYSEGDPARYPIKPKKAKLPTRRGHAFVIIGEGERVLTELRPPSGLLGGMQGLPGSSWGEGDLPAPGFPFDADWQAAGQVRHVFTHFALELSVWRAKLDVEVDGLGIEAALNALPTVFAKALRQGLFVSPR